MLKGAIGRRYAEAIFDIARENNTIDRTLDDVQGIASMFSKRTLAYLLKRTKGSRAAQRDSHTPGPGVQGAAHVAQPGPACCAARTG